MSTKRRFLDVWIIEGNTVYKEVPFDVAADWVQQGRLLEGDMLRPSGTSEWTALGSMREFAVYLPKPAAEPEIESQVEPMEPIETGFHWKRKTDDEDSEVDMIPLIDVSLVLLIFFMLTTNPETSAAGPQIATPPAVYGTVVNAPDEVWVGINLTKNAAGDPVQVYSLGVGSKADARNLATRQELLDHLAALLANKDQVDLTIDANSEVPSGDVRDLTVALEQPPFRSKIKRKYTGVSDKQP
jgi:biopolymer transport protein ExbD